MRNIPHPKKTSTRCPISAVNSCNNSSPDGVACRRRAACAASALGIYVYQGETGELPSAKAKEVEDVLLRVFGGADTIEVRRRALESVSFSGRREGTAAHGRPYET